MRDDGIKYSTGCGITYYACIQFRKKLQRDAEVPIVPAKGRKSVIVLTSRATPVPPLHPRDSENQGILISLHNARVYQCH
jgi:hypothetical protein